MIDNTEGSYSCKGEAYEKYVSIYNKLKEVPGLYGNDSLKQYMSAVGWMPDLEGELDKVYHHYQQLGVSLRVPILDWGRREGQYQLARSRQEIARISAEQAITSFEQDAVTQVLEFNLRQNKVLAAAKSDTIAQESYELTTTRFRKGNVDVLQLTSSQNAKDNARLRYVRSLHPYWSDYYAIRNLTLFDFVNDKKLE